jgi:hypothetical protein
MVMYVDRLNASQSRIGVLLRELVGGIRSEKKQPAEPELSKLLSRVQESGLFDATWYLKRNPDVARANINPLLHYVRYGGFEGRDPNPKFSSRHYLAAHPDLAPAGINPLYHFIVNRVAAPNPERSKGSVPSGSKPVSTKAKTPQPVSVPTVAALPWKAIVEHGREAGLQSRVVGVARPRGEAARRFELIRVDEDVRIDRLSPTAGYLFDIPASDACFGWEGTMTAANNLANQALVRHLRAVRAAKLPTVLVYDAATLSRPFYKDFQSLFSVHVDQRVLEGDEALPGPFAALRGEPLEASPSPGFRIPAVAHANG